MKLSHRLLTLFSGLLLVSLLATGCSNDKTAVDDTKEAAPVELNVSAAASLTDAIGAVNTLYMENNKNVTVVTNLGSSGTLQTQIEQGAPADVFISAAAKQMNALQDGGLIIESSRRNLLNNKVVLIVPANSTLVIDDFTDLTNNAVQKIAIGDPEFVPAGSYAKQALELLGIYETISEKLILGSDVRQVLAYVESGNVDAGIVYSTDAAITDGVKIAADGPAEINDKIVYPVAIIKSSKVAAAAQAYIDFLGESEAAAIFSRYGFSVVTR